MAAVPGAIRPPPRDPRPKFRRAPSLESIRTELAERHLADFMRQAWQVVVPDRPLQWGWHLDAISEHLEAVILGQIRRLVISVPFRTTKSTTLSVMLTPWVWIRNPGFSFLYASHSQPLSTRDSVAARTVIESKWYQDRWGGKYTLTSDQNQKTRFLNSKRGERLATSVGSRSITGEGGDLVAIDDAHDAVEAVKHFDALQFEDIAQWWDEVMSSRHPDPKTGRKVICGQRIHGSDLSGHVLAKGGWQHLILPMEYDPKRSSVTSLGFHDPRTEEGELLCPDRFGPEEVEQSKIDLGDFAYQAQAQQDPLPRGGTMFKVEWIRRAPACPGGVAVTARGWDFAGTKPSRSNKDPDYTVGLKLVHVVAENRFYVIPDMVRMREEPGDVENALVATSGADGFGVRVGLYQDPAQAGKYQVVTFAGKLAGHEVCVLPAVNLFELIAPVRAQIQVGNVIFVGNPDDPNDPLKPAIAEVLAFPGGKHDDVIAALGAAFHAITRWKPERKPKNRAGSLMVRK